jgi:hypothetical protein
LRKMIEGTPLVEVVDSQGRFLYYDVSPARLGARLLGDKKCKTMRVKCRPEKRDPLMLDKLVTWDGTGMRDPGERAVFGIRCRPATKEDKANVRVTRG